jgi:2-methylisocitrate lyase-like PEP mutase family enzyme
VKKDLTELGVRRSSMGGALARVAWGGLTRMAREIAEQGDLQRLLRGRSRCRAQ